VHLASNFWSAEPVTPFPGWARAVSTGTVDMSAIRDACT
jgi:hypothetical protein